MSTPPPERAELSGLLRKTPLIAVIRAPHTERLAAVCDTLVEEGVTSLELTLTTPGLLDALPTLVNRFDGSAEVGVGTVLLESDAQRALDAGADYLVTPVANRTIVALAVNRHTPIFPGGLTPTELAESWADGATAVKIFPAQTVGSEYLRLLHGPFPELRAIPSGGVDLAAAREWLQAGAVAVSVGSPLLGDAPSGGDLAELRTRCRAYLAAIREIP
jgi:2-dehydro-3-deoxyphosphogluconate aldolase/(4S)-4-hydroxy-2-oxoglutarate aldolase